MKLKEEDLRHRRTGLYFEFIMGVGGLRIKNDLIHLPTKCTITWEQHGQSPHTEQQSYHMKEKARALMKVLIKEYPEP